MSKIEQFKSSNSSQLFVNISSEALIGDEHISILTNKRPGSTPEDPMAFVALSHPTHDLPSTSMSALEPATPPVLAAPPDPYPTFTKIRVINVSRKSMLNQRRFIILTRLAAHSKHNTAWLKVKSGEILRTNRDSPGREPYNWYASECRNLDRIIYLLILLSGLYPLRYPLCLCSYSCQ
jgi:hypothetical protein